MTWTKNNFLASGFLILSCLSTKVLGGVTFKESLELAFKNNEDVLIQKERIQKAAYTYKKARGAHFPTLTGSSSLNRSKVETSLTQAHTTTNTYGVTLATDLYSGNATNLTVKQALLKKKQGKTGLKQIKLISYSAGIITIPALYWLGRNLGINVKASQFYNLILSE